MAVADRQQGRTQTDSQKLRLFIAIYPAEELLLKIRQDINACDKGKRRFISKNQIHLTVSFLGDVESSKLELLKQQIHDISQSIDAFSIQTQTYCCFPLYKRPRLMVLCCQLNEPLATLHYRCEQLKGSDTQTNKPYLPHITVFRDKHMPRHFECPVHIPMAFEVRQLSLMSSTLTASGAIHTSQARYCLKL